MSNHGVLAMIMCVVYTCIVVCDHSMRELVYPGSIGTGTDCARR